MNKQKCIVCSSTKNPRTLNNVPHCTNCAFEKIEIEFDKKPKRPEQINLFEEGENND